jgi:hypothetical protein
MKRLIFAIVMLCAVSSNVFGSLITLVPEADLNALLGPGYTQATTVLTTPMVAGPLNTEVYSQAYVSTTGEYAYLYQVNNVGTPDVNHYVESFTLFPTSSRIQVGFLNFATGLTAPFLNGGQDPWPKGSETAGLLDSFAYNDFLGKAIVPGNHSLVMYITSKDKPGMITGNVIDGAVASGPVWGAVAATVPEPSTLVLLICGGLGCWLFKRYRSR